MHARCLRLFIYQTRIKLLKLSSTVQRQCRFSPFKIGIIQEYFADKLLPLPFTFLSRLLVPEECRAFRMPVVVVDHRVGFFLDGVSSVWIRGSAPPNGPLTLIRAGSLLRRTWRGISGESNTKRQRKTSGHLE